MPLPAMTNVNPGSGTSRRQVLVSSLSTGFALAVTPIAASALSTASDGLEVGEIKIATSNGEIPGYRALPLEPKGKLPVILVVHEIFGVHEHIKDVCRRFAKAGYYALAPDLFARQGDVSKLTDFREIQSKVVSKVPDAQVLSDLDAALAFAKKDPRANAAKLAITGFCWGGRIVWLYAAQQPAVKAAVAWYGKITGEKDELNPRFPEDVVTQLKASSIHVYPDAGHAFFADYRPSFHKESAEDGWKRALEWFKTHHAK